jgi:hypothetical protein
MLGNSRSVGYALTERFGRDSIRRGTADAATSGV